MELHTIKDSRIKSYYKIDRLGNIYSTYKNKVKRLAFDIDKDGYYRVSLQTEDNKRTSFRVNRLVALTFLPNPNNYPVVHHINGDKQDNNVDNLKWVTISQNTLEGYKAHNYHYAKPVRAINVLTKEEKVFGSLKECSEYYGVKYFDISKIAKNKMGIKTSGKIANIDFMFIK